MPIVVNGGTSSPNRPGFKATKTLRFADHDQVREVPTGKEEDDLERWWRGKGGGGGGGGGVGGAGAKRRPGAAHHDGSVERYFDNLITMIEDAAEGL